MHDNRPPIETGSATWVGLCRWIDERIGEFHREIETFGCPERQADFVRGKIAMLREIRRLDTPPVFIPDDVGAYED